MLTETEVRDLLQAAADMFEVRDVATPVPLHRRRRSALVAAAAAVLVTVASLGVVGLRRPMTERPPSDRPTHRPVATTHPLADDQVPSVFGYDAASARRLLESRGLRVDLREVRRPCSGDEGRALRTDPPLGTRFDDGDAVTLVVGAIEPTHGCTGLVAQRWRPEAWQLVDFANGRGPVPAHTDLVTLSVNGTSMDVTGEDFADPTAWPTCEREGPHCPGSALDVLAEASQDVLHWSAGKRSGWRGPGLSTLFLKPSTVRIWVGIPEDGIVGPQWYLDVTPDATGAIRRVALTWRDLAPLPGPSSVVPFVTAMSVGQARAVLEAAGFDVTVVSGDEVGHVCTRGEFVVAQSPLADADATTGSSVTLRTQSLGCGASPDDPGGIGHAFVRWAGGAGEAPLFAPSVRLYRGNVHVRTITADQAAAAPAAWDLAGTTGLEPPSALRTLAAYDGPLAYSLDPHTSESCPSASGPVPSDTGGTYVVAMSPPEPASCRQAFEVQLWIDGAHRISAVNLLTGRAPPSP